MTIGAYSLVSEGWNFVTDNLGTLFKCSFFPVLLTFSLLIFVPKMGLPVRGTILLNEFCKMMIGISFMSCWYNAMITGRDKGGAFAFRFGTHELKMFLWYCLLVFTPYLLMNFYALETYGRVHFVHLGYQEIHHMVGNTSLGILCISAFVVVLARFVLIFPALSVGEDGSLRRSWELTRGHWWVLVRAYFLLMCAVSILTFGGVAVLNLLVLGWTIVTDHLPLLSVISPHNFNCMNCMIGDYMFHLFSLTFSYFLWGWALTIPGLLYKKLYQSVRTIS